MRVPSWDHNAWYHRTLLRRLPPAPADVLDAGCGTGALAARLAGLGYQVTALDRDAGMVAATRARLASNPSNQSAPDGDRGVGPVVARRADLLADPLPEQAFDAVVTVSVLHHLPLSAALPRLAAALRPGGVLIAVALPRVDLPREAATELAALVGQVGLGSLFALLRRREGRGPGREDTRLPAADRGRDGGGDRAATAWFGYESDVAAMPMRDPTLTTREVRAQAAAALPGSRVRRLAFWRYLLVWHRPA